MAEQKRKPAEHEQVDAKVLVIADRRDAEGERSTRCDQQGDGEDIDGA